MRIIDILNQVKIEDIAEKLIQNHNHYFNDKEKTIDILRIFYKDINSIQLEDISNTEYKDFTVIVNEYYDDNSFKGENIFDLAEKYREKVFDFSSVTEDTLDKYFVVDGIHLHELRKKKDNIITNFYDYLEASKENFEDFYITSYGLDFIPRKTILACEVAELSIQKFGLVTCATEIFWELTFYGLTDKQVQKESSKLDERVEDIEDITEENLVETKKVDFESDFEIDKRDIDFSMKFSKKVSEFDHKILYEFYKELANMV